MARRIVRPSRQPRATAKETPQPSRPQVVTADMVRAREEPQARRDFTAENRAWMEAFESARAPARGWKAGDANTPNAPTSPNLLACMVLSTQNAITAQTWDWGRYELLVAQDTKIDVLKKDSGYWVREQTIDVGDTVTGMSSYQGRLAAVTATKIVYYDNYKEPVNVQNIGVTGATAVHVWTTNEDTQVWTGPVYTPPEFFVITADASRWYVYDLTTGTPALDDDTALPALHAVTAVDYREGVAFISYAADGQLVEDWAANTSTTYTTLTSPAIANDAVNDVDVITGSGERTQGLLNVYWTVGTATLASTFRQGVINDITGLTGVSSVVYTEAGRLALIDSTNAITYTGDVPTADIALSAWKYGEFAIAPTRPNTIGSAPGFLNVAGLCDCFAIADTVAGLTVIDENAPPRPALSEDFNEPNVTEAEYRFNEPDDRILTDPFNDNSSGWILTENGTGTAVIEGGLLKMTRGGSDVDSGFADLSFSVVAGKWYKPFADVVSTTGNNGSFLIIGTTQGAADLGTVSGSGVTTLETTIQATTSTIWLRLRAGDTAGADFSLFTFDEVQALEGFEPSSDAIVSIDAQRIRVENGIATRQVVSVEHAVVTDKWYTVSVDVADVPSLGRILIGNVQGLGGTQYANATNLAAATYNFTFKATSASLWVNLAVNVNAINDFAIYDDVIIEQVPALDGITPKSAATVLEVVSGELQVSGETAAYGSYAVDTVSSVDYDVTCLARRDTSSDAILNVGTTPGASDLGSASTTSTTNVTLALSFASVGEITYISMQNGAADTGIAIFDDVELTPEQPVASPVAHITITYNTGYMVFQEGAWANDTFSADIVGPATLPDNSGLSNDAAVTGTVVKAKFNRCVYAIQLTPTDTVTITHDGTGNLEGWVKYGPQPWEYFEHESELKYADSTGTTVTLQGSAQFTPDYPTQYGFLSWNNQVVNEPGPGPGFDSFDDSYDEGFE